MLDDLYRSTGPDSHAARVASVIMGPTETLFYTVAAYLGSVGINSSRHIIPVSLLRLLVSIVVTGAICRVV